MLMAALFIARWLAIAWKLLPLARPSTFCYITVIAGGPAAMHFHPPKPLHGWHEFAEEASH